jgi:hypothetical protein
MTERLRAYLAITLLSVFVWAFLIWGAWELAHTIQFTLPIASGLIAIAALLAVIVWIKVRG